MKTPVAVSIGAIDPFERVMPERRGAQVPVFVASARTPSGRTDPARFYSDDRSRVVRVGRATVDLGSGFTWEELVEISSERDRSTAVPVELLAYEEFGPLWSTTWPDNFHFARDWQAPDLDHGPGDTFVAEINDLLAGSRRKQITIYVHGFNTTFDHNVEVAAEFWHYMGRDGVLVSFEWASRGNLFSYQVDKSNANFAIRQFRELLEFLAEETDAEQINILAHSAGNPVVVEALRQTSLMMWEVESEEARRRTKIARVVLAAPDMDLDTALSAGVDGARRITHQLAVYASKSDKALSFAGRIFGDVRMGRSIGKLTPGQRDALIRNDADWIDATNAQKRSPSFLGHSYFHQNPWVSSDVMLLLRVGATPAERGLVRDVSTGFLVFPDDYEERLPSIVENLRAKYDLGAGPTTPVDS